jgi:RNA polymerase sigma-70 factor (ECF subfamily)
MDEIADLIEPHIPALRRYAWALARDHDRADDLVQDCLERAISRWHLRRRDGNARAWLFTILHNLFVSQLRRRARRGTEVGLDDVSASASVPPAQDNNMAVRDVLTALALLPEEQRAVLLLVGVEDLSYEETARVLGVPIGTVMSRLSRGRGRLREVLESGRTGALRRVK